MKKLFTAYNKDVQKYIDFRNLSDKRKDLIIEHIETTVIDADESFEYLFPPRSKRKDVMDHIIYLLSGNGIWKIAAATLAEKADCSVRTVNEAVKALKKTGEVLVGGLADGKNKYVFVLKSHDNFKEILKDVFYINAEQIAEQVAEQKSSETFVAVSVEDEKTSSNNNNSIISKQEKDIIKDSIESELNSATKETEKDLTQYYVNPFQKMLYDTINANNYHVELKRNAAVLGLRLGSNATKAYLNMALQAVFKIDKFLSLGGTVDESIPAMFTKMYTDLIKYTVKPSIQKNEVSSYPLFNWLEGDFK